MLRQTKNAPTGSAAEANFPFSLAVQEYVEIIRDLSDAGRVARIKDIAEARGVSPASVSTAVGTLAALGLVEHRHYGYVVLTEAGGRLGEKLRRRHEIIRSFFEQCIGLERSVADREACVLEHSMSEQALDGLVRFIGRYSRGTRKEQTQGNHQKQPT